MKLNQQKGSLLVISILIIFMVSMVVFYTIVLNNINNASNTHSINTIRNYYAAKSAMEWAVYNATACKPKHDALCDASNQPHRFEINNETTNAGGNLVNADDPYIIEVICDDGGGYTEASLSSDTYNAYAMDRITVIAHRGGAPGDRYYVRTQFDAKVSRVMGVTELQCKDSPA